MRSFVARIIGLLTGLLVPILIYAQDSVKPCLPGSTITCLENGDIAGHFYDTVVSNIFMAFGGIMFAALVFYSIKLAAQSRTDSIITETMTAYTQVFAGATLVMGASIIANSFGKVGAINPEAVEAGVIAVVIAYIVKIIGAVLVLNIVVQGIRILMSEEEGMNAAKSNLIRSFVGVIFVMLGAPLIQMVSPGAFNSGINYKLVGVANFIGVIFGILAVVAIIVSGIMLIVSVNESLKDRAKSIIISALAAIIVVAISVGLIQILLP